MVGPRELVILLMRDEMVAGVVELVVRDSRIATSEGERREVSSEGGCACDGEWFSSWAIFGMDGGRSSASSDCRSDFSLQCSVSSHLKLKNLKQEYTL